MKTLRYMGHAMGLLLRSAMQYRASFLMQTLSQAVMTGGDLLAVAVLLGRFTRLGPWSGPEILFFFGVMQCVFALGQFLGRGVATLPMCTAASLTPAGPPRACLSR